MEGSPNNEPSGSKGGKPQWSIDMIQAADAWDVQKGNTSILVAVIDSGSDQTHPDLAENYVALGYDWVNNDSGRRRRWRQ